MPHEDIAWYNSNLPREQWTASCPEDLQDASEKDKGIIGGREEDFEPMSWETVKLLIDQNRINEFHRSPRELRRYRQYIYHLQKEFGSVMKYMISHRLRWTSLAPSGPPFANAEDIKILYNDWPYGVDSRIVHLVVWVKFELEDDPVTGFLTQEASSKIEHYVEQTFYKNVKPENVAWFKNWKSLKSVHAVEHFHVMLYDPDMSFIHAITNGDVPTSELLKSEDQH